MPFGHLLDDSKGSDMNVYLDVICVAMTFEVYILSI